MPLEKSKSEWRARVASPGQCKKDSYYQAWPSKATGGSHYPYNSKGIRQLNCRRKSDNKNMAQSIRFSTKKQYEWTSSKIKSWIKSHGHTLKGLYRVYTIDEKSITECEEHMVYLTSTEAFEIKSSDDGEKKRIVIGIVSSDQIDKHGEVVSPDSVIKSWKEEYYEFPTVRLMHDAEPIGRTLKMWKKGNKVWAKIEIFDDEDKIWNRIKKGYLRAFSIGFRILKFKEVCPTKNDCHIVFTEIMLVEISLVDSPANTDAVIDSFREELKNIGGDALVKKMITKAKKYKCECIDCGHNMETEKHCKDIKCPKCGGEMRRANRPGPGKIIRESLDYKEYVEWENDDEEKISVIELGDSMDKKKETPEVEKNEDESEESEEEELEEEFEEDNSEDSTDGDSEEESSGEEDFIDADETESEQVEENKELTKLSDRVDGIEETLKSLTDVIKAIQESLSSNSKDEDDKDKKIKELESKLEEKKKPKRVSHRKVDDVGEKKSEEEKMNDVRKVVEKQLKWYANTK